MSESLGLSEQALLSFARETGNGQSGAGRKKAPPPFSLRLSLEERAALERAAAGQSLGAYIRSKLFEGDLTPRRTRGHRPVKDHTALAKVLGALGQSRLSSNLNQLAKAAHIGALPVTPELEEELSDACAQIREMRTDLLKALGHHEPKGAAS